jgi:hypothetical protein
MRVSNNVAGQHQLRVVYIVGFFIYFILDFCFTTSSINISHNTKRKFKCYRPKFMSGFLEYNNGY